MYSAEINYWLWEAMLDILVKRPEIGFLYVHIISYNLNDENESARQLKYNFELTSGLFQR